MAKKMVTVFKSDELAHFGILGMKWGVRKVHPGTQRIIDRSNKVLNNPKSTASQLSKALIDIGIDPKTGRVTKTSPKYDKDGNDISVNPYKRIGKPKNQSDKDFDKEIEQEIDRQVNEQRAEDFARQQAGLKVRTLKSEAIKAAGAVVASVAIVGVATMVGNAVGDRLMQKAVGNMMKKTLPSWAQ